MLSLTRRGSYVHYLFLGVKGDGSVHISGANAHMDEAVKTWIGTTVCCILILALVLMALQALPVGVR
jgi:hypothetical protein